MELRRYLELFRRRWVLIAVITLLAIAAAYQATPRDDRYVARSTLYIGSRTIDPDSRDLSSDRAAALDRLVLTFGVMIDSEPIATRAIGLTGISRSAPGVVAATTATPEPATQLLYIDVVDSDPAAAQAIANGLADAFVEAVQDFEPGTSAGEGDVPVLPAYIFERARLPTVPTPNGLTQNLVLGGLLGLGAAAALVLLLEYLDVSVKSAEDAERLLDLPVLGVIPSLGDELPLSPTLRATRPMARGR